MSSRLSHIIFVLDRPKDVANIGAVVRLLGNFGLSRLRLVEPVEFNDVEMLRFARRGTAVTGAIERVSSVDAAIGDCAFVLGATRRPRTLVRPILTPREAAPILLGMAALSTDAPPPVPEQRAAVLFGPEDFGLSNASLERCHAILTIPTVPDDASLNLAQAALLVAYELHTASSDALADRSMSTAFDISNPPFADGAQLEVLFSAITRIYAALHSTHIEGQTNAAVARLRALVMRGMPRVDEIAQLTSLFEHLSRAVQGPESSPSRSQSAT